MRTAVAVVLAVGQGAGAEPDLVPGRDGGRPACSGLAYLVVYYLTSSGTDPHIPLMADLGAWNFAVGFGVMLLGLIMAVRWR